MIDELDKGATATVYRATCKTKEGKEIPVAVKIIDLEKSKTGTDKLIIEFIFIGGRIRWNEF